MITISEKAQQELDAYFQDKEKSPIRIYLAAGGWHGPRLALALDEPSDEDNTITIGNFSFCMNKELTTQIGSATIDLTYMGFTIEPEIPLASSGSACGSCASSCSS